MAHDLAVNETTGEASMTYAGDTPWHGLGFKLEGDERFDLDLCRKKGKMDFELELAPLQTADLNQSVAMRAVRRKDNQAIMGCVGMQYQILQPIDAFSFFRPFVEQKLASLHTAGLLAGGRKIWTLAKIEREPIVLDKNGDDRIEKFVLLSNCYDGTTSVRVGFTPIRVVCANTLSLAIKDRASQLIRVRHTKSMKSSLENIRSVIDLADQQFKATAEQYKKLVNKTINRKDLEKYVRTVFDLNSDKLNGKQTQILGRTFELFETGKGSNLKSANGTLWGAFNAVNSWLNWERGINADTRLTSLWYGAAAKTNQRALETAIQMAV